MYHKKITCCLIIFIIVFNLNIGFNDEIFLRIGIGEVNAVEEWEILKTWWPEGETRLYQFIYEPLKYKYRCRVISPNKSTFNFDIFNLKGDTLYGSYGMRNGSIEEIKNTPKLLGGTEYKIACVGGSADVEDNYEWKGNLYFERQLINTDPTLTLTSPTSNSPLQGRQAHIKEAA